MKSIGDLENLIYSKSKELNNKISPILKNLYNTIIKEVERLSIKYDSLNTLLDSDDISRLYTYGYDSNSYKLPTLSVYITYFIKYSVVNSFNSIRKLFTSYLLEAINITEELLVTLYPTLYRLSKDDKDNTLYEEWSGNNYHTLIDHYIEDTTYKLYKDIKFWIISGTLSFIILKKALNKRFNTITNTIKSTTITELESILNRTIKDILYRSGNIKYTYHSENDSKVCSICKKYNGKEFYSDSKDLILPPIHPHCRCYIVPNL